MHSTKQTDILLTIDVEDWFQVENLRPWFPPYKWEHQTCRVENNTMRLLDLFDSFNPASKATFFVLGWIARKFPSMVREIQSRGHEIASHGEGHLLNAHLDEATLRQDLETSKKRLEDITGTGIHGYRAPNFSINDHILTLIKRAGYSYDSSYNSFDRHGRYGKISTNEFQKKGIAIKLEEKFTELPISNLSILNQTIPWGGGGYFRLYPPALFTKGVRRILSRENAYLFYMHPWEIDPKQPKVATTRLMKGRKLDQGKQILQRWRHYLNLDKTQQRLKNLLTQFKTSNFITCTQYLKNLMDS